MNDTNSLAGTSIALVAIVSLTLAIAFDNSRGPVSRERHPIVTAGDAGVGFSPRGQRTRPFAATPVSTANLGRNR